MGFPYNELVAPALLLDNPGVTAGEFIDLLDQTHSSCFHEYGIEDSWDFYTRETEDNKYHRGLDGLTDILGLKDSQSFLDFQKKRVDENGLLLRAPLMLPAREGKDYKFEVITHERNVFGEPTIEDPAYSRTELAVGDIWEEPMSGHVRGIVLDIINKEVIRKERIDEDDKSEPEYFYKIKIRPFHSECKEEQFKSEDELYEQWPQFHPKFTKDWSQKTGSFVTGVFGKDNFLWKQEKGRYYLDERTFDRISASFRCSNSFGYTDLILTSEAIKHKAWKVLSYKAIKHLPQFLKEFPEVIPRYERAVWDSHTSLSAKMNHMTISDLLRFRMSPHN